ncbi:MAG: extracellular solute-binding protein [Fimbriimonas sp.]
MKTWRGWLGAVALVMAGCGPTGGGDGAVAPEAPKGDAKPTGKVEVMAFKGGYGIDMYEQAAKEFAEKNPGVTVDVSGNPRVWEQIRPRMLSGNPPDLMFPGWGMDHWALVEEGQVMALDAALDSPAEDGKGTWRDTFDPNILKLGQRDGKTYMLPYYIMVWGWWYDPGLFAKHGWTPPKTWDELLALAPKMKAKGIAPITYQGQYPFYMLEGMLLPWAGSIGGPSTIDDAQNLVPGAWKSPAMLQAAKMIDELNQKGYFQEGATGMSHTEAQTQFLNGKAAMIPCGSWLSSEMEKVMPAGAKLEYFVPPSVTGGKGDPSTISIGVEPWMVPTEAKNPQAAISLYKYMTSLPKAKEFVEKKGTLMAIKGSDDAKLPEVLVQPAAAMKAAKTIWSNQYRAWYPAMQKEIEGALTSLLNKESTPEQFVDRCEAAAEKTRKDASIKKYKVGS